MLNRNLLQDAELWRIGDTSNDGVIDALDCISVQLVLSGHVSLTAEKLKYYDIDGSGDVDIYDLQQIMNYSVGIM